MKLKKIPIKKYKKPILKIKLKKIRNQFEANYLGLYGPRVWAFKKS